MAVFLKTVLSISSLFPRPPTGYQNGPRRQDLAGVLQPSKDVPFEPLADPMDEGEDGDILAQPLQVSCLTYL